MTYIEEEVSVGRHAINLRKGGCGGRKESEGAVKVRRKREKKRIITKGRKFNLTSISRAHADEFQCH